MCEHPSWHTEVGGWHTCTECGDLAEDIIGVGIDTEPDEFQAPQTPPPMDGRAYFIHGGDWHVYPTATATLRRIEKAHRGQAQFLTRMSISSRPHAVSQPRRREARGSRRVRATRSR